MDLRFLIIFIFFSYTCFPQEIQTSILVNTTNSKIKEVSVFLGDLYGNINILSKEKIDSNGNAILNFKIKHTYFAFINFGNSNQVIYIKPGKNYQVSADYTKKYLGVIFRGYNSEINNYLEYNKEIFRDYKYKNKEYYNWNVEEFAIAIQKIDSILTNNQKVFFDKNNVSEEDQKTLKNRLISDILSTKMNHFVAKYSVLQTDKEVPQTLQNLENLVPFDTNLLQSTCESYLLTLKYYYIISIKRKLNAYNISEITQEFYLKFTFSDIRAYKIPDELKEFMLADLLIGHLIDNIPEKFNEYFDEFKKDFPHSQYTSTINERLNKFVKMVNNQASEIIGSDINNQTIKLSDYKGKLIYIDFWATWCGPCIAELPYSLKLQKRFRGNADIVFLYVSIDIDFKKWKNYLTKHTELTGIHINLNEDNMNAVKNFYAIYGIPRYLIIGKDGKIKDSSAERPSSSNIYENLRKLL
jgi:thiol-disulfide isomerase/thioredoxin